MGMLRLFFSVFGEFQAPLIGLEYELKRVESFTMDPLGRKYSWNDAKGDEGEKRSFGMCGHGLSVTSLGWCPSFALSQLAWSPNVGPELNWIE